MIVRKITFQLSNCLHSTASLTRLIMQNEFLQIWTKDIENLLDQDHKPI